MKQIKVDTNLIAKCGLYCGACAIKNGQIGKAASDLKRMLEVYEYASWTPYAVELFPATKHYKEFEAVLGWLTGQDCPACRAGGGNPACEMRKCARERKLEGCFACDDEATCEHLALADKTYPVMAENRRRLREIGKAAWLEEQAAKVAEGFSYLDFRCPRNWPSP